MAQQYAVSHHALSVFVCRTRMYKRYILLLADMYMSAVYFTV